MLTVNKEYNPRTVVAFSLFLSIIISFSRIVDNFLFWVHGIIIIWLVLLVYVVLRSGVSVRMPKAGAVVLGLVLFGLLNGLARGFGLVDVFRDATPVFALIAGLLVMNVPASRILPFLRLHLIFTGILMAVQVFVRFAIHPTSTSMDLYFYRAGLPLYATFIPAGALLLWLGRGEARLLAFPLMVATALTFGRVEYGVIALTAIILLLQMPRVRSPAARLILLVLILSAGGILGALGAVGMVPVLADSGGGALSRLSFDLSDPSLGWRVIEVQAFIDWWNAADPIVRVAGEGLGSTIRLPGNIRDFTGNPSIPILHISPLTWVLKFGIIGLFGLVALLVWLTFNKTCRLSFGLPLTWLIVGSVAMRGLAQHGLYEPWPLFLLGVLIGSTRPGFVSSDNGGSGRLQVSGS